MAHSHHSHERDTFTLTHETWSRVRNSIVFVALAGWIATLAGFFLNREQFHFSFHVSYVYFISIALGALFFVMVQHLSGSVWSVTVRRLMENAMLTVPVGIVLFALFRLGTHQKYEWSHDSAKSDPVLSKKLGYLNEDWFTIRGLLVLLLWALWAVMLYRESRRQDDSKAIAHTKRSIAWSGPGVIMLFLTASLAAFDWNMSLDAHWWSTMFGVQFLAGGAVAFMAVLILVCLALRSAGYLRNSVTEEHYHDLGKWLFAVTVFWAYVTFSQYMLIWYSNLPEETFWFMNRLKGSWYWFRPVLIIGHFAVPFIFLMPRGNKRNLKLLGFFAVWMLLMHLVDLHWQVMPVLHKEGWAPHWLDLASFVAVGGTFAAFFWRKMRHQPIVPVGDPRLEQCLGFHNA